MTHYLGSKRAYTACFELPDNGIRKLDTTDNVDKVTCQRCIEAIWAEWENEK